MSFECFEVVLSVALRLLFEVVFVFLSCCFEVVWNVALERIVVLSVVWRLFRGLFWSLL